MVGEKDFKEKEEGKKNAEHLNQKIPYVSLLKQKRARYTNTSPFPF